MMASIAERTEHSAARTGPGTRSASAATPRDPAYTIAYSACAAARDLHLAALVVPTLSGRSARLISAHRPQVPIFALSPGKETVRRCSLMWGVQAASMRRHEVDRGADRRRGPRVVELGWVKPGARVGITAGLPSGRPGTTSPALQRIRARSERRTAASSRIPRGAVGPDGGTCRPTLLLASTSAARTERTARLGRRRSTISDSARQARGWLIAEPSGGRTEPAARA